MSLDRAELTAATRPLNRARSMPAGFYTDPAIFKAERAQVFLKHWFFLTRTEELPEPGDYRAFDSPGTPARSSRSSPTSRCTTRRATESDKPGNAWTRVSGVCPRRWILDTD